jgi:ribosomal protein L11 methylase PrmA
MRDKWMEELAKLEARRLEIPPGRSGHIVEVENFSVFADTKHYTPQIIGSFVSGTYEGRERELIKNLVRSGDRVIEAGTAVGIVSMTAASVVGPENVSTFDANPDIVRDAEANLDVTTSVKLNLTLGFL